jgi:DNA-binding IclR family transcriptional regulator
MRQHSAVGTLDKSVAVLDALTGGPLDLAALSARTGMPRATAHRLAMALEQHRLVARVDGAFTLGPRLAELAQARNSPLSARASDVLHRLTEDTGESSQLYVREDGSRRCIAAVERGEGLRDTVPVGALLPMTAGSAAQVLLAWDEQPVPLGAAFTAAALAAVRRRGWAASVGQRTVGVASVSAPVRDATGDVVAAVSISGPAERLTRSPGTLFGPRLVMAGAALSH